MNFKGVSAYSMLHERFPIKRFLKCYPDDMAGAGTAICANRFGVSWGKLKMWCSHFKTRHCVEAHFMSGPARRNRSWDMFDHYHGITVSEFNRLIVAGTLPKIEIKIHKFAVGLHSAVNEKTKLLICPELEDNLSNEAFKILLGLFKAEFKNWKPRVGFVRSPCKGGTDLFGCYYEVHGRSTKSAHLFNPDGVSVDFYDGEKYFDTMSMITLMALLKKHAGAKLRLIWSANMQGVGQAENFNYPPPTKRAFIVTDKAQAYCRDILGRL